MPDTCQPNFHADWAYYDEGGNITALVGAKGQRVPVGVTLLTPAEIASPSAAVLADKTATFQNSVTGERYKPTGVGLEPMPGLRGATSLSSLQALSQASTRRVDLVMLGDSNQTFGGYGFCVGLEKALSARFPVYATPQLTRLSPPQYSASSTSASDTASSGLSVSLLADIYRAPSLGDGIKANYSYQASGSPAGQQTPGISVPPNSPIGVNNLIRVWFAYGVSASFAGGSSHPGARIGDSPYTPIVGLPDPLSSIGNFDGLRLAPLDIPAATRNATVEAKYQLPAITTIVGPWVGYYTRAEIVSRASGISCHTLYGSGGQSAWDMAWALQNTPDETLRTFFAETRRLQISAGYSPIIVVYINTMLNDLNETNTPSLGPSRVYGTGNTPAEYVDNLRAVQDRIKRIWEISRWPIGELHWLFVPSHRTSDPESASVSALRSAAASAFSTEPQTSVVNLGALMTAAAATTAGWYDGGGAAHLTATGYDGVSNLVVGQIP